MRAKIKKVLLSIVQHKHFPYVAGLTVIGVATHIQWFNPWSVLTFGDWQYRPDESVKQMISSWQTWVPFEGLGSVNILMSGFPFRGIAWGIITNLGFSYDIATKLTMFIPLALGASLSAYLLVFHLTKDRTVAFVTSLFYSTTPYYLLVESVHGPIGVVYALTPLIIYLLDLALRDNTRRIWLALSLVYCVGIFYEVRIMYIVTVIMAVYFGANLVMSGIRPWKYIPNILYSSGFILVANLFWLVPTKMAAGAGISETADVGLFGNNLFNLAQSFTVMRWNWTGDELNRTFMAQPVHVYLFIIPLVAFVGFLFAKRYIQQILLFSFIALLGIFLTKQSDEPFAGVYYWLYHNFPGFVLFREASKFYLLVAFGYVGMIAFTLLGLRDKLASSSKKQWLKSSYGICTLGIILVAAVNLWPAATQHLAGTFKNKDVPADYVTFSKFIHEQPEFFRTYWMPRESWWGFYDNQHPKISATDILNANWKSLQTKKGGNTFDTAHRNVDILSQTFSQTLLNEASVKYVVVPVRDTKSDDDFFHSYGNDRQYFIDQLNATPFLRKVDIGSKELAVYENTTYKPYISTASSIYNISGDDEDTNAEAQLATTLGGDFSLSEKEGLKKMNAQGSIKPLFNFSAGQNAHDKIEATVATQNNTKIVNYNPAQRLAYEVHNNTMSLLRAASGVLAIGGTTQKDESSDTVLQEVPTLSDRQYYFSEGDVLVAANMTLGKHDIVDTSEKVTVYESSAGGNFQKDTFAKDSWKGVQDCSVGKLTPYVNMDEGLYTSNKNKTMTLYAQDRHIACVTHKPIAIAQGDYRLHFVYSNIGGKQVAYKITFNDPARTVQYKYLPTSDSQEREANFVVHAPAGATQLSLQIMSYTGEQQTDDSAATFSDFSLHPIKPVYQFQPPDNQTFQLNKGTQQITYTTPESSANNIKNPSFEQGLWQNKVSDCHNYDSNPVIGMALSNDASNGKHALKLTATRHIACTYQDDIPIASNSTYLFSFDAKAINTNQVRYQISFNDPSKTVIEKRIDVESAAWQKLNHMIQTPPGASYATVRVDALPNSFGRKKVDVFYDNFKLQRVPSLARSYFVVTPPAKHDLPRSVELTSSSPTRKHGIVKGANGPFYLTMSEAYDSHWRLDIGHQKGLLSNFPLSKHAAVSGNNHASLDASRNVWYVDTALVCKQSSSTCTRNNDGTYNINFTVEFTPQRWFNLFGIVSFGAVVAAVIYVAYPKIYKLHRRK